MSKDLEVPLGADAFDASGAVASQGPRTEVLDLPSHQPQLTDHGADFADLAGSIGLQSPDRKYQAAADQQQASGSTEPLKASVRTS